MTHAEDTGRIPRMTDVATKQNRNLKDLLWPLGGTLFGLFVIPIAIAQYPTFFNENRWILPASVSATLACWVVPLLLHDRTRWVYSRIAKIRWLGKPLFFVLCLLALGGLVAGGRALFKFHSKHLAAAFVSESSLLSTNKNSESISKNPESVTRNIKSGKQAQNRSTQENKSVPSVSKRAAENSIPAASFVQSPTPVPNAATTITTPVAHVTEQNPHRRMVFQRLHYQALAPGGMPPRGDYLEQRLETLGEPFGYSGEDYGQNNLPSDEDAAYQLVDEDLFRKRLAEFKGTSILIAYAPDRWLLAKQIHEGLLNDEWRTQKHETSDPQTLPKTGSVLIRMAKTISEPERKAVRALLAELVKNGIMTSTEYVEYGQPQILIPSNVSVGGSSSTDYCLRKDQTLFLSLNWPLPESKEAQFLKDVFGDTSNLDVSKRIYLYWVAQRGGTAGDFHEGQGIFSSILGVDKTDHMFLPVNQLMGEAEKDLVYQGKYIYRDVESHQIKLTPIFQQKLDSVKPKPQ